MRKRNGKLLLLLTLLLTWKLLRTDWIVLARFWSKSEGIVSIETFSPPVSPFWHPPKPHDIEPTATTWGHEKFFGIATPTEEPQLYINWPLMLIKLAGVAGVGCLAFVVVFRVVPFFVHQAKTPV